MNIKKILIGIVLLSATTAGMAQGRIEGQNSFHGQFGFMPTELGNDKFGFMAKAGYGRVLGSAGFMGKVELFYGQYQVKYKDDVMLPYNRFGIEIMPGYSYEKLYPLMINGYLGVFGNYETVNNGSHGLKDNTGVIVEKVESFNTGIAGSIELELWVLKNFSVLLDFTQYYDFTSKFSIGKYAFFGGIKYSF